MDYSKFGLDDELLVTNLFTGDYKMMRVVDQHIVKYVLEYHPNALLTIHTVAQVTTGTIQPVETQRAREIKFSFSLPKNQHFMSSFQDALYIEKIKKSQKNYILSYFYEHIAKRVFVFVVSRTEHYLVKIFDTKEVENTFFSNLKSDRAIVDFKGFQQKIDDFENKVFGDGTN